MGKAVSNELEVMRQETLIVDPSTDIDISPARRIPTGDTETIIKGEQDGEQVNSIHSFLCDNLTRKPSDKYEFQKTVGRGGMKAVFKVHDRDTVRNLAMAVIGDSERASDNDLARFIKEARITANLEHPNIVPIHDIGVDSDGAPYFTMKLIEGDTLADILNRVRKGNEFYKNKYNLSQLLQIFQKVCNAINFAHSKGVVHLDLKPGNIEVGGFGDVLVLDWGLAKYVDGAESYDHVYSDDGYGDESSSEHQLAKTIDGIIKGTPGYMAPEQAAGLNDQKDHLTDIYSLGAILYNIITFEKPIVGKDVYEIIEKTIDGELEKPSKRKPEMNIPKPLEAITMKAMSVDREDRYQNVSEVLADIDAFISGFATVAENAGIVRLLLLWRKRNKALSVFATIAIVVTFSFVGMWVTNQLKHYAAWGQARDISPGKGAESHDEWLIQSGNWVQEDGEFIAAKGAGDSFKVFYNKPVYGNIAVEFDAIIEDERNLEKSGDLSVVFSGGVNSRDGYYLQVGGFGNSSAVIQRDGEVVASKKFSLEAGETYHIRAEKDGGSLRLYCDGDLLVSWSDIFYREGGHFGLYTFGEGKRFWNIKLYSKGVSELVSPLDVGDGLYRESCARNGYSKTEFLKLARDAYSRVYDSHHDKETGQKALLKRSYVDLELGNIASAKEGAIELSRVRRSLDNILLAAEIAFREARYENAYQRYNEAVNEYPDERVGTVGMLITKLADRDTIRKINSDLLNSFWRMYAQNQTNSILRCSNKFLSTLTFLEGTDFNMIDCSQNFLTALDGIKEMNPVHLNISDNDIESLDVLKGMNIESLECYNNPRIYSLEPLRGMPLKKLAINGCRSIRDLTPLLSCESLERLCIPKNAKGIETLKSLPNLKYLSYEWDDRDKSAADFWREFEINKNK